MSTNRFPVGEAAGRPTRSCVVLSKPILATPEGTAAGGDPLKPCHSPSPSQMYK